MRRLRVRIVIVLPALAAMIMASGAPASDAARVRPLTAPIETSPTAAYFAEISSQGRFSGQLQETGKRPPTFDTELDPREVEKYKNPKSTFRAFLYSLVIPGAGQLYTGSKTKAVMFFGFEALTWAGYVTFQGRGDDKTAEFEAFADIHWGEIRYSQFLFDNWGVYDDDSVLDNNDNLLFTHHLPDTKTQQYYEMIGKYNQFVFGWDDVDSTIPRHPDYLGQAYSANRQKYEDMRGDANKMYGRATASIVAMMANHLISGIEAALAAKSHNKRVMTYTERVKFKAYAARRDNQYFPMLTMTYRF